MEYRVYSRPGWNVELFHEPNLIPVGSTQGRHNLAGYWLRRRTVELSNSRTVEQSNCRTVEQLNSRTVEQSNCRTVEQLNCRTVEQSNGRTVEQSNGGTVELSNSRTIERSNSLTVELSNSRTVEQQWNSRTKYIQKSYAEMGCGNIKYNIIICAFDSAREDIDVYESESFQSRNFRLLQARSSTEPLQLQ